MQVGTTKDQGLYNKPSAAVHAGALAAGTLPQYNRTVNCFDCYSENMHEKFFKQQFQTLTNSKEVNCTQP